VPKMASMATALRHPRERMTRSVGRILTIAGLALFVGYSGGFGASAPPSPLLGPEIAFVVSVPNTQGRCDSPLMLHADKVGGVVYEATPGGAPADPDAEDSPDAESKVELKFGEETVREQYGRLESYTRKLKNIKGKFWFKGAKPWDVHQFTKVCITVYLDPKQAANSKIMAQVIEELRRISAKHPKIITSLVNDMVRGTREGDRIGATVSLTGRLMQEFLERYNTIVLPRIRDFEGLNAYALDKRGDFLMTIHNQEPFPELDEIIDQREIIHSFLVRINNNCLTQPDGLNLMKSYGFPFGDFKRRERKEAVPAWKKLAAAKKR